MRETAGWTDGSGNSWSGCSPWIAGPVNSGNGFTGKMQQDQGRLAWKNQSNS
jgi:hypothetical protein